MFDYAIMNETVDYYRRIGNLADLFKFYNTTEISQCVMAQTCPHLQQDPRNIYVISEEKALNYAFSTDARFFDVCEEKRNIYEMIVFLKNNINGFLEFYFSLADEQSRQTLLAIICSQLFQREDLLSDVSDPLLLVGGKATFQSVNSISEILYQADAVKKKHLGKVPYLRLIQLADNTIELKIFADDPQALILNSAEQALEDIAGGLDQLVEMNKTLGEALTLSRQYMLEGQVTDALPIIATCDTVLKAMTQVIEKQYPKSMADIPSS